MPYISFPQGKVFVPDTAPKEKPTVYPPIKRDHVDLSKKKALVYGYGIFDVFLAQALAQDFGEVFLFVPWMGPWPTPDYQDIGRGIPGITRVLSYEDTKAIIKESKGAFFFFDVGDGDKQRELRAEGCSVFGTGDSERLETDRYFFKETLKQQGLSTAAYHPPTYGIDALSAILRKEGDLWVKMDNSVRGIKETFHHIDWKSSITEIDEMSHKLGYKRDTCKFMVEKPVEKDGVEIGDDSWRSHGRSLEYSLYGIEIKGDGYACRPVRAEDIPAPIKTVNAKMLPVYEAYDINGAISSEVRYGEKKEPFYIDACFDDQTEILTDQGWKFFKDLDKTETVATMKNGVVEYQKPIDYINKKYIGKLINVSNDEKTIECTVTPNHLVLRTDRGKKILFKEQADSLTDKGFIPRTGKWEGIKQEYFTLPEYRKEWKFIGQYRQDICIKKYHAPEIKIEFNAWISFLAWYLSEGSLGGKNVVQIFQKNRIATVRDVFKKLGFTYTEKGGTFRIYSTQMAEYLSQFGLCSEKYIPNYIKNATPKQIEVFLQNYCLGDGCFHKRDNGRSYATTSKRMADDIQELIFKIGHVSKISLAQKVGSKMQVKGKTYTRKHDGYIIYESTKWRDFWFETQARKNKYITEISYSGKVYCVTVPNGTIYVRKNGKPFWSSNCQRMGNPPAACISEIYKNFSQIAEGITRGIMVKQEFAAKYAAELSVEALNGDAESIPMDWSEKDLHKIKLRRAVCENGQYYNIPFHDKVSTVVKAVGLGETLEEAETVCMENAENFKCKNKFYNKSTFLELQEVIDKCKTLGIESL